MIRGKTRFGYIFVLAAFLSGCLAGPQAGSTIPGGMVKNPGPGGPATATPFQPQPVLGTTLPAQIPAPTEPTIQPPASTSTTVPTAVAPTETPVPVPVTPVVWLDPRLPGSLRQNLALPSGWAAAGPDTPADGAPIRLVVGGSEPASRWVYALVAPFPSRVQGVSSESIRNRWKGQPAGPFGGEPLMMDENTRLAFSSAWGDPAPDAVRTVPISELLGAAWNEKQGGKYVSWVIVPFEDIDPRWKVLEVDGQSPLRKEFDLNNYALTLPISLEGDPALIEQLRPAVPASNRDPNKLTVVAMTGVTALVRATAFAMEQRGVLYPGKDIRDWLRNADITHISNEVPFAEDCPYPNPVQEGMKFCSDPRYIALLEDVGTDIVELTGDHFADWGTKAMEYTLDLYRQRGWQYYGGGENLEEGRQPLLVEHNGNKLAFIGCNGKGPAFAHASSKQPGAVVCDYGWMQKEIARLRQEGYLPIATFQHFEYYTYKAQPNQLEDFRGVADAGAVVVSGSQAHQPQQFELRGASLIHYGLGNLFFDQYGVSEACRQAFVDRHVFYNGRYLGVELLPMMFVDYARPRPMTQEEQDVLYDAVFSASGW